MDDEIRRALASERTVDITTTGRKTGQPRRVEIWFHAIEDTIYLTGSPGKRDWYANLLAQPDLTFHLKKSVMADLPARAVPITDETERRVLLDEVTSRVGASERIDDWVARSPLVRVEFEVSPIS